MFFSYFFLSARVTFVTTKVTDQFAGANWNRFSGPRSGEVQDVPSQTTAPNTLPCGFPAMLMEFGSLRNSLTLKQVLA
jgi:hypothetical protein